MAKTKRHRLHGGGGRDGRRRRRARGRRRTMRRGGVRRCGRLDRSARQGTLVLSAIGAPASTGVGGTDTLDARGCAYL